MDPKNRRQPKQVTVEASSFINAQLEIRKQYGPAIEYQNGPVEKR